MVDILTDQEDTHELETPLNTITILGKSRGSQVCENNNLYGRHFLVARWKKPWQI